MLNHLKLSIQFNILRFKNVEKIVPLKYLRKSWRTITLPLIKFEIIVILSWPENSVITNTTTQDGVPA